MKEKMKKGMELALSMMLAVLMISGVFMLAPAGVAASEGDTITLGAGAITTDSRVYFGNQILWRVLQSGDGKALLISNNILDTTQFHNERLYGNRWNYSKARKWCTNYYNSWPAGIEKDAILATTVEETENFTCSIPYSGNRTLGPASLNNEHFFFLSAKEVDTLFADSNDRKAKDGSSWSGWWLRSPDSQISAQAAFVTFDGLIYITTVLDSLGARPAFSFNLQSILFSSLIPSSSNQYILTLKDENLGISKTEGMNVKLKGSSVIIPYSVTGTNATTNTQAYVMVTKSPWNDGAEVLQYEKLASGTESGIGSFTPASSISGTWGTDYHVYLLAVNEGGEKKSNYAGTPVELTTAPEHAHSFAYEVNGASITATCETPDCDISSAFTLTMNAPTGDLIYNGSAWNATISGYPTTAPDNLEAIPKILYYKSTGNGSTTTSGDALSGAPSDAGDYVAQMTWGGKTVRVAFSVAKADSVAKVPTGLMATYGQTLDDVTLTNPTGNTEGTWAWVDSTASVGSVGRRSFLVNFTPRDETNYYGKTNVRVTVIVWKAENPAIVTDTATVMRGGNTVDLANNVDQNGATGAVGYGISGNKNGCSMHGSVLTSGEKTGSVTVYVSVASDDNYYALANKPVTVMITDKNTQTITADDVTAAYGDTEKSVSATTDGDGVISYDVKTGSENYIAVDASTGALTIKAVPADGSATVIVTAAETATYAQATKEVTVTINKANAVAATVTANNRTYDGTEKPLVTVTGEATGGEMQYALGTETEATEQYTTSIPTATNAGTYYVWYKAIGDENHNSTEPVNVEVTISPSDKAALNKAIAAAKEYCDSIRDYTDIAAALKTAIDAAEKVAKNDNITEADIAAAISTLNGAVDTAKADVKKAADEAAAKKVVDAINALPDNAGLDDKPAVEAARAAYDALTDDQKKLVPEDVLAKLTAAEDQVKAAEKQAADEAAAKKAVDAINALPDNAGLDDKAAVEAARAAYDALTDDQKKLVPEDTLAKLTAAEEQIKAAEKKAEEKKADEAAAKKAVDAINALPENAGVDDKPAVEAARAAYDALTDDQKKLVPEDVLAKLATAENQVKAAEEEAAKINIANCKITAKNRVYTGNAITPRVTVKYNDKTLKAGTDYTLSYSKNLKAIGTATVTVKGMGDFTGSRKVSFRIIPKETGLGFIKVNSSQGKMTLKWIKRQNITGYQIEYGLKKDFRNAVKLNVKKTKHMVTIRNLEGDTTYYVRIRTFRKVGKKVYFSAWSGTKVAKTEARATKNEAEDLIIDTTMNADVTLDLEFPDITDEIPSTDGLELPEEMEIELTE